VAQPALARYQPEEFKPGVQYQSDEDLARLAGDIATTIFHPVGTTKMGRADDPMAVLDPRLRARHRGLRVVDAGAMPTITSGNTNSPTLMMAEKAAQWILETTHHSQTLWSQTGKSPMGRRRLGLYISTTERAPSALDGGRGDKPPPPQPQAFFKHPVRCHLLSNRQPCWRFFACTRRGTRCDNRADGMDTGFAGLPAAGFVDAIVEAAA
jgi:hypothetical protein